MDELKSSYSDKDMFLSLYNKLKKEITEKKIDLKESKKQLALNNPEE